MNKISTEILKLIKQKGITYGELSNKTGIPKSVLQRYATGETTKIPINCIESIAKALDTKPAYILGWEQPEETAQHISTNQPTNYDKLNDLGKQKVDEYIQDISKNEKYTKTGEKKAVRQTTQCYSLSDNDLQNIIAPASVKK